MVNICKKKILQLRCSNVVLHLKYKLLFCESKIKFQNLPGGKALAIDNNAKLVCLTQNTSVYYCSHNRNRHFGT